MLYYSAMFLVLCFGSYVTYSPVLKNGIWGLPLFLCTSLCYTLLWWGGCRGQNTKEILLLSLVCDILMIVAYYIIPMIINRHTLNWQMFAAAFITLIGLSWLKGVSH